RRRGRNGRRAGREVPARPLLLLPSSPRGRVRSRPRRARSPSLFAGPFARGGRSMNRVCSLLLLAVALVVFAGAPLAAADEKKDKDKNTHTGTFVSAKGKEFTMKDKEGKEHTHTLAADAKCYDADGKPCKLSHFKAGERIRVTTKEGDKTVAVKVE